MVAVPAEAIVSQTRLDAPVTEAILHVALTMPSRKVTYDLCGGETPDSILDLGEQISQQAGQPLNTAVLKRYDNRDAFLSGAYVPHIDPERYAGKVALVSLDSLAYTFFALEDRVHGVECTAGTLLVAESTIEHWVTPPLEGNTRHFLFYGHDTTLR